MSNLGLMVISDDELRRIFKFVYARAQQPLFLQSFAAAFLCAEDQGDFQMMRPLAVVFVAKYSLACYLNEPEGRLQTA